MLKLYALLPLICLGTSLFPNLLPSQALAISLASKPTAKPESQPASAVLPPAFELGTAGVCWLYNLSGYLALDAEGEVVALQPYCQQQRNWAWHEPALFWRRFREVASAETLRYSQQFEPDAVEAYGQTICLFLKEGGSPEQLAQIQADQAFPSEFERAVTTASINSLCREYRKLRLR